MGNEQSDYAMIDEHMGMDMISGVNKCVHHRIKLYGWRIHHVRETRRRFARVCAV
jgi:hypothetical protein